MKKKDEKESLKTLKFLGLTAIICLLLAMIPYDRFLPSSLDVIYVNDSTTATKELPITKSEGVLVTFMCSGNDFSNLLSIFTQSHQNLKMEYIDTIDRKKGKNIKEFIVTFTK